MFTFKSLDEQTIALQEYRALSVVRCKISHGSQDDFRSIGFLNDLIASSAYHISYLSPESWRLNSVYSHGPFAIGKISPKHYHRLTKAQFVEDFMAVLNDPYYPEQLTKEQITAVIETLSRFSEDMVFYRFEREHLQAKLHNDEYEMDGDWSSMLWEFVEFLVLDPSKDLLYILVLLFD